MLIIREGYLHFVSSCSKAIQSQKLDLETNPRSFYLIKKRRRLFVDFSLIILFANDINISIRTLCRILSIASSWRASTSLRFPYLMRNGGSFICVCKINAPRPCKREHDLHPNVGGTQKFLNSRLT